MRVPSIRLCTDGVQLQGSLMTTVSDDVKRATGVQKRPSSNSWHWGIKAPSDLKHLYASQWAHRCSLETADLREANTKAAGLRAEWMKLLKVASLPPRD
ncbi:DUF6538 domain-containing protein [Roseateles chitosanitabidus]|uniref:DUF6538 domain-containing protein n=2 Tax=Roseateles chitosanitabidus TaxID=65048 RepID=UPI00350E45C1